MTVYTSTKGERKDMENKSEKLSTDTTAEKHVLNAAAVSKLFIGCLFEDGEPTEDAMVVKGITTTFGFHPERLGAAREKVGAMLLELPEEFMDDGGKGWTFLNACNDKHGHQWGEHQHMQELFTLGIALGYVAWMLPREMWEELPGCMPYVTVKRTKINQSGETSCLEFLSTP